MNKCYEEFSSCMERSAINTANAVFLGDDASQEYQGYVFFRKCIYLNLIICKEYNILGPYDKYHLENNSGFHFRKYKTTAQMRSYHISLQEKNQICKSTFEACLQSSIIMTEEKI